MLLCLQCLNMIKPMKKKLLLLSLCAGGTLLMAQPVNDPVLMKINGKDIKKSEFEYIYNKNNQQQLEHKSLDEYLVLFTNYKLKVAEAEAYGLDTVQAFKKELAGYRKELAKPYLVDSKLDEQMAREAYHRLKENVEVEHILFSINNPNDEAEKKAAFDKAMQARERILKGEDFGKVAFECSDDPSAKENNGYLGFIKGFRTVLPFEDAVYSMKPGDLSKPVLSQFGYHIIKVLSTRPDPGSVLTAHIALMVRKNAPEGLMAEKEKEIKEIYNEVINGGDFAKIAKEKSEDRGSSRNGGQLPWCNSGDFVPEFEKVAFALKNKGDISEPVLSPFGWHIIKLLDRKEFPSFEEKRNEIMNRLARDSRGAKAKESLVTQLKEAYHFKLNQDILNKMYARTEKKGIDSLFLADISKDETWLFSFDGGGMKLSEFGEAITPVVYGLVYNPNTPAREFIDTQIKKYVENQILTYEENNLDVKYPDFRNLMNEYRDGMLLFEISNREVWEKASQDTQGLEKYFKKNKKKYNWKEPHFKGYLVQCANDSVAGLVQNRIKTAPKDSVIYYVIREFNNDSVKNVRIERGLYVAGDNANIDNLVFAQVEKKIDEKFPVMFTAGKILKKGPEEYTDVRGQVTADYQTYLEKVWVKMLNKKYPVEINKDVLKTVNKQ